MIKDIQIRGQFVVFELTDGRTIPVRAGGSSSPFGGGGGGDSSGGTGVGGAGVDNTARSSAAANALAIQEIKNTVPVDSTARTSAAEALAAANKNSIPVVSSIPVEGAVAVDAPTLLMKSPEGVMWYLVTNTSGNKIYTEGVNGNTVSAPSAPSGEVSSPYRGQYNSTALADAFVVNKKLGDYVALAGGKGEPSLNEQYYTYGGGQWNPALQNFRRTNILEIPSLIAAGAQGLHYITGSNVVLSITGLPNPTATPYIAVALGDAFDNDFTGTVDDYTPSDLATLLTDGSIPEIQPLAGTYGYIPPYLPIPYAFFNGYTFVEMQTVDAGAGGEAPPEGDGGLPPEGG